MHYDIDARRWPSASVLQARGSSLTRLFSLLLTLAIFIGGVPATQAQACAADTPTPGVGVVKEAYDVIAGRFVEPVSAPTLLAAAAGAVVVELRRESNARPVPDADAWFAGDSAASWERFAEHYCQAWESRGDRVAPEALAYPAIRAMAAAVHEAHTGFLTPEMYREHLAWTSTGEVRYDGIGIRLRPEPLR